MSNRYELLRQPVRVGSVELRNRFVMTGHVTGMASDHMPEERLQAYYRERAAGGVAMIVSEAGSIHPTAAHMNETVNLYDDRIVKHYRRLTKDLHGLGCRFVAQLWHCGHNTGGLSTGLPLWSPSPIAGILNHEIAHELDETQIAELVASYASCATTVRAGGVDGVEIHMGHGYLPQQFMSPLTNVRTDSYGKTLEGRMRFPLEVLAAVREAAGADAIVGIRLSVEEGVPDGLAIPEMQEAARMLVGAGHVSYISASFGTYANMEIQVAPTPTPPGHLSYLAAAIKKVVDVPVLAVGRILHPDLAEQIVAAGEADLIGMARELIADPDYVTKALEGRADEIRRCVGCNYCQSRLWFGTAISCVYNPAAGRERELGRDVIRPAETARRILVVGGGPGGLEAARMAASRGHRVTLAERGDALGGQLLLSGLIESRAEMLGVLRFLMTEIERHGVEIALGRELSAADVIAAAPDAVVVATGSTAHARGFTAIRADEPTIRGLETTIALSGRQALTEPDRLRDPVVLIDLEGHVAGLAVADFLLGRGHRVTFVTPQPFPGSTIGAMAWVTLMQTATAKGVDFLASHALTDVDGASGRVQSVYGGEPRKIDVGSVVVVGESTAEDSVAKELVAAGFPGPVLAVGDCVAPRHLDVAILEGARAGLAL